MKKFLPKISKGFTLVELLVVVSIIAILAVIGMAIFSGVQKNARDARRKGDIDAIAKAMEVNYGKFTAGQYAGLCQTAATPTYNCSSSAWFTGGGLPADPQAATAIRYCWVASGTCNNTTGTALASAGGTPPQNTANWVICATLETGGPFCRSNQQ